METKGFATRFPTVKNAVLSIMKNDEFARRNDLYLCLRFWAKKGMIEIIVPRKDFNKVTCPESISRARRKLFEEARKGDPKLRFLLKEEETINMRRDRETEVSNYFANEKFKQTARIVKWA